MAQAMANSKEHLKNIIHSKHLLCPAIELYWQLIYYVCSFWTPNSDIHGPRRFVCEEEKNEQIFV